MNDELKPMQCGCGGEAEIHINYSFGQDTYRPFVHISCSKCGISTQAYIGKELVWHPWYGEEPAYRKEVSVIAKAKAIEVWNRAMGERMAKIENIQINWHDDEYINDRMGDMYHFGDCGNCGETVTEGQKYCSNCGARLEWE